MNHPRVLYCLCLSFLLLAGCRVQTLYLNGEAQGRVVDALSGTPIAGARGRVCGVEFMTGTDGSFRVEPATDWTLLMPLAGRSPQDTPHPCYMSIAAPDYQTRQWLAPFTANYDFAIRLLPASSSLRYALPPEAGGSVPMDTEQAPPRQDEVFLQPGA